MHFNAENNIADLGLQQPPPWQQFQPTRQHPYEHVVESPQHLPPHLQSTHLPIAPISRHTATQGIIAPVPSLAAFTITTAAAAKWATYTWVVSTEARALSGAGELVCSVVGAGEAPINDVSLAFTRCGGNVERRVLSYGAIGRQWLGDSG
jgi:hypothetical protein